MCSAPGLSYRTQAWVLWDSPGVIEKKTGSEEPLPAPRPYSLEARRDSSQTQDCSVSRPGGVPPALRLYKVSRPGPVPLRLCSHKATRCRLADWQGNPPVDEVQVPFQPEGSPSSRQGKSTLSIGRNTFWWTRYKCLVNQKVFLPVDKVDVPRPPEGRPSD
ncbi:uncharacterized protein PGTG_16205 [Puccinia graminis f. sp. tritici CRL 75-36-700-3]|uniref:Uncharacterized protein n=1 Tax=Puccinia graminis f. sp. tritici (strain CRL 75-36-700-3 / race SCCL) TaxID=418459 RepID=E3L030_PUCGT|nr:uncharacterized protein PGTG_16205 [Puccinia graminis f. sp. tritici CRL 75-36-700-3]EFP89917.2 hypothetical protein PGTG_16205 [Puccinia graminis f. sp. tritici CRL 75-36-700-3]